MGKDIEKLERKSEELGKKCEGLEKENVRYKEQIEVLRFGNLVDINSLYEEIIELQKGKIELYTKWLKYYEEKEELVSNEYCENKLKETEAYWKRKYERLGREYKIINEKYLNFWEDKVYNEKTSEHREDTGHTADRGSG